MAIFFLQILNGIAFGMLLFLLAAGLTLIFGSMKILNLTHGSYYLFGGYVGYTVVRLTGSFVARRRCRGDGSRHARHRHGALFPAPVPSGRSAADAC